MEFTGERFIPEIHGNIELEHLHRYLLAKTLARGKNVLDIASGEGYGSAMLAEVANHVIGVDISDEAVKHARNKYKLENLEFRTGSCADIPVGNAAVDLVVSFETIEHHDQHDEMLSEIKRVLRPQGVLIISSPDKYGYSVAPNYLNPFHVKELFRDQFEGLLRKYFKYYSMYGQRVIYGSGIFSSEPGRSFQTFEKDTSGLIDHSGMPRPIYEIALAADLTLPVLDNSVFEQKFDDSEIVLSWSRAVTERDGQIASLSQAVTERDGQIASLSQAVTERDGQIVSFSHAISQKESAVQDLRTSLAQRDEAARNWESTLNQIQNSHGWKLLQYYYRLRDKLLPMGSHRNHWIKFVWRVATHQSVSTPGLRLFSVNDFREYLLKYARRDVTATSHKEADTHNGLSQFTQALFERERGKKGWNTEYVPRATDSLDSRKLEIKTIAFYLPQFHPIPENDKWWGKGFTEWTNVTRAVPQFLGHYQPRLPSDLGFYDLRLPEVMRQQVEIARQYGVFGFCFHYYWFDGKKLLEGPLNHFLSDTSLDMSFCVCWANENWTRRWDGLDQDILIAQHHSPDGDRAFIESLLPMFQDPRYIKIDGKPVLLVYRIDLLPSTADTVQRWRDTVRKHGFTDLYVVAARTFDISNLRVYGVDAAVEFPPHQISGMDITASRTIINPEFKGRIYDYTEYAIRYARREWDSVLTFKTVMPSWDNEARRPGTSHIFFGSTPLAYAQWLRDACKVTVRNQPNERLLFVNAWNEWAEGAYLEPDSKFGYGYLHATANILRYHYRDEAVATFINDSNARFTKTKDIAIVVHCYHEELVPEMVDRYIQPHAKNTDLFVTLRPDATLNCVKYIQRTAQNVFFIREENRGRDIRPFLLALRQLDARGYAYACKIHTKKSLHLDDGERWRDLLTNSLLGAPSSVCEAQNLFSRKDRLGILSPIGSTTDLSAPDVNHNNRIWLDKLLTQLGRKDLAGSYQFTFPAGSMYWFRVAALARLDSVVFPEDAFELEVGQLDGTLAHAIERLISLYASTRGYHTEEAGLGSDRHTFKAHHIAVAR